MKRGVQNLKADKQTQTTFFLLSNSNAVYIDTILQHQGMAHVFDEIVTNPAHFEQDGTLSVQRRIPASAPQEKQHKCQIGCSPNMCKGKCAMASPLFSPSLLLSSQDHPTCFLMQARSSTLFSRDMEALLPLTASCTSATATTITARC